MGRVGAGEVAQLVQCLSCKPEDLSRIPRSYVKRSSTVVHNTDKKEQAKGLPDRVQERWSELYLWHELLLVTVQDNAATRGSALPSVPTEVGYWKPTAEAVENSRIASF